MPMAIDFSSGERMFIWNSYRKKKEKKSDVPVLCSRVSCKLSIPMVIER